MEQAADRAERRRKRAFLSYLREDQQRIENVAQALIAYDLDVWFDTKDIEAGRKWAVEIRAGIEESDFFVPFFSRAWNLKPENYMRQEIDWAITEAKNRGEQKWIVPVVMDGGQIPEITLADGGTLPSLQWVSLSGERHQAIARFLTALEPNSGRVHTLIGELESSSARARIKAADQLGALGSLSQSAVPKLAAALQTEKNETVLVAAACALGEIGDARATVLFALKHSAAANPRYASRAAVEALRQLGSAAAPALIELAAGKNNSWLTNHAGELIWRMGPDALPLLVATSVENPSLRKAAKEAIENIVNNSGKNWSHHDTRAALGKVLEHRDPRQRSQAQKALRRLPK